MCSYVHSMDYTVKPIRTRQVRIAKPNPVQGKERASERETQKVTSASSQRRRKERKKVGYSKLKKYLARTQEKDT